MTIDLEKYVNWRLEGISLENYMFTVNLVRQSISSNDNMDTAKIRARIIAISIDKVILSNISDGMPISRIRFDDGQDILSCTFELSSGSSIEITAREIVDIAY